MQTTEKSNWMSVSSVHVDQWVRSRQITHRKNNLFIDCIGLHEEFVSSSIMMDFCDRMNAVWWYFFRIYFIPLFDFTVVVFFIVVDSIQISIHSNETVMVWLQLMSSIKTKTKQKQIRKSKYLHTTLARHNNLSMKNR